MAPEPSAAYVIPCMLLLLMVTVAVVAAPVFVITFNVLEFVTVKFIPFILFPEILTAVFTLAVLPIQYAVPDALVKLTPLILLLLIFKVPIPAKPERITPTSDVEVLEQVKLVIVLPLIFMVVGADCTQIAVKATAVAVVLVILMVLLLMLMILPAAPLCAISQSIAQSIAVVLVPPVMVTLLLLIVADNV